MNSAIPSGPLEQKWSKHKMDSKLINPANKRKYNIIVVGTGLAGGAAAATLAELGYQVKCFCYQDSPRRAHSIAAQGGINAAKNYQNDGDSRAPPLLRHDQGRRLPRPRSQRPSPRRGSASTSSTNASPRACPSPANTAACSTTAPSAARRSPAPSTPAARPASSSSSAAYQALEKEIAQGRREDVSRAPRCSTSSLVDGHAKGIVVRDMVTGKISSHAGDAVILATGGYGNVFFLSTNAMGCNVTAAWRAAQARRALRQSLLHADPPDLHPRQRRLPVEAHADVRVAPQRRPRLGAETRKSPRRSARASSAADIPEDDRDYYLERKYPTFGNLAPRDISSRAAKEACDDGRGVGPDGLGVYLDFARCHQAPRRGHDPRALRQPLPDV